MKIISKLKNTPKISILTDYNEYCQSDKIVVNVVAPPSSEGVKLELQEFWHEKQIENDVAYNVQQIRAEQAFIQEEPEFSQELGQYYSFTLSLPQNCRISTKNSGWSLEATTAGETITNLTLKVLPAKEFLAIISVLEKKMRFKERKSMQKWHENGTSSFRLIPPAMLKPELDFIYLSLHQEENNSVTGSMTLKIKEKTIDDYFNNIAQPANIIRKTFQMEQLTLLTPEGNPNVPEIVNVIAPMIQESIQN